MCMRLWGGDVEGACVCGCGVGMWREHVRLCEVGGYGGQGVEGAGRWEMGDGR